MSCTEKSSTQTCESVTGGEMEEVGVIFVETFRWVRDITAASVLGGQEVRNTQLLLYVGR